MKIAAHHQTLARHLETFRQTLHQHPELSNEEYETTARLRAALEEHDIRVLDLPLKTGLVAEIGGQQEGPLIALRSDIDALPIVEEADVPWKSLNTGVMHACGHDFHASAALGAAILLKAIEPQIKGRVRILFQPAEEVAKGAIDVLNSGALEGVQAIFGIHNDPTLPVGVLGTKAGALTAGVDRFGITITAKGSHAARPQAGNDPIIILGQLISIVQGIVSRRVAPNDSAVVSITHVESGSTWNVIPDTATLEGTVRTFSAETRALIEAELRRILDGLAHTYNAKLALDWQPGPPSVDNTAEWADVALEVGEREGFEARRVDASPIGEDFALYQQTIPGVFVMIGSGGPHALHHPAFRVDDRALFPTAHYLHTLALAALDRLAST
ncbi:amidohydrolase [Zymobacter sp. IVIA_5232.4 C2]|uniref:amidohydrolase n=1 Tax=Zymobacter sp. IVIA_5232.4 C2 TaxID=3394855 RepID=UPI0039C0AEF8